MIDGISQDVLIFALPSSPGGSNPLRSDCHGAKGMPPDASHRQSLGPSGRLQVGAFAFLLGLGMSALGCFHVTAAASQWCPRTVEQPTKHKHKTPFFNSQQAWPCMLLTFELVPSIFQQPRHLLSSRSFWYPRAAMSETGVVKFFNSVDSYGFIRLGGRRWGAAKGSDVYVHRSAIADGRSLLKGDTVSFDVCT